MKPRYPDIRVRVRSRHPLVAVSAVRHALRRSGIDRAEIRRFSEEALAGGAARADEGEGRISSVCRAWARVIADRQV